jgi:predicted GH43/DUF377 family glycosyl hydrolase
MNDINLSKIALNSGGCVKPLLIDSVYTNGTGLMNPSIFIDGNKILVNVRHVNYTFYHSEKKIFQHQWGPLTYIHPEDDMHLRTTNFYCELNKDLSIDWYTNVDTSKLDVDPLWDFVGLEDARIVRWDGVLYLTGVRRDTTTNGQGRMELSEIIVDGKTVKEVSRLRIPAPNNPNSYCEKNWMPFLDLPYHYVKWSNPTEVVTVNTKTKECKTIFLGKSFDTHADFRGGSQIVSIDEGYIALVHEVMLFNNDVGRKDAVYRHRFLVWDKNFNLIKYSTDFSLMGGHVEFSVGMCKQDDNFLITFGFQDNAAYIMKIPQKTVMDFING